MAQQGSSNLKVIALAVVCVVLIASTVGALALYFPAQTQITEKDQTIASLNQQIAASTATNRCSTQHQHLYSPNCSATITNSAEYNATLANLSTEYQNLQKIADLAIYGNLYSGNFSQDAQRNNYSLERHHRLRRIHSSSRNIQRDLNLCAGNKRF